MWTWLENKQKSWKDRKRLKLPGMLACISNSREAKAGEPRVLQFWAKEWKPVSKECVCVCGGGVMLEQQTASSFNHSLLRPSVRRRSLSWKSVDCHNPLALFGSWPLLSQETCHCNVPSCPWTGQQVIQGPGSMSSLWLGPPRGWGKSSWPVSHSEPEGKRSSPQGSARPSPVLLGICFHLLQFWITFQNYKFWSPKRPLRMSGCPVWGVCFPALIGLPPYKQNCPHHRAVWLGTVTREHRDLTPGEC